MGSKNPPLERNIPMLFVWVLSFDTPYMIFFFEMAQKLLIWYLFIVFRVGVSGFSNRRLICKIPTIKKGCLVSHRSLRKKGSLRPPYSLSLTLRLLYKMEKYYLMSFIDFNPRLPTGRSPNLKWVTFLISKKIQISNSIDLHDII